MKRPGGISADSQVGMRFAVILCQCEHSKVDTTNDGPYVCSCADHQARLGRYPH